MNPFYEKRSGKLQIGVSDNMNFPAHLHDDVEVLYCWKAESRFLSWEKPTWSAKGNAP